MPIPSGPDSESNFSVKLSLDLRGRQKSSSWPWFVAVLLTLVGSSFLWRLIEKWLTGVD